MSIFTNRKRVQVVGKTSFRPWKEWKESEFIVAEYQSTGEDQFGNPSHKVKILETNIKDFAGTVTLNSCGGLNKAIEQMTEGSVFELVYGGKDLIASGKFKGKEAHSVTVSILGDEDATIADPQDDL
jgi:hypothetical protein